ncbi:MAG TPA: MFS transporter [Lacipirellulaceae bacterium]|nr:MFS transporter [Lacipirellulaceae bacterium]
MTNDTPNAWWRDLTRYHWFVFIIASAAWFFDCLDQRLFTLARNPALETLTVTPDAIQELGLARVKQEGLTSTPELIEKLGREDAVKRALGWGKNVTAYFLIGWGVGGLFFGALGDRYGRSRMLTLTVLMYSVCTGLSYFSKSYFDFALFRFLTGIGVGGVFGLAVALIAETLPDHSRSGALGWLQILSTVGNLTAGLVKWGIDELTANGTLKPPGEGWRWMFLVGSIPALLVVFTMRYLKEPEPWLKARAEGRVGTGGILSPYANLLKDSRWRRNLVIGALISAAGVVGLWAIGEYATDLQRKMFTIHFQELNAAAPVAERISDEKIAAKVESARTWAYTWQMVGAAVGMWFMTKACISWGRKPAFLVWYLGALVVTLYVYWTMKTPMDAYWMMPLMWFFQLGVFAGFAIYLPELFPSRLRSTGTSFCYNLGRFAAAIGSFFSAKLAIDVYGSPIPGLQERYAAMTMCAIFLIGILTLPFAPETKGQPLPE